MCFFFETKFTLYSLSLSASARVLCFVLFCVCGWLFYMENDEKQSLIKLKWLSWQQLTEVLISSLVVKLQAMLKFVQVLLGAFLIYSRNTSLKAVGSSCRTNISGTSDSKVNAEWCKLFAFACIVNFGLRYLA
jgi:hypothetical protein